MLSENQVNEFLYEGATWVDNLISMDIINAASAGMDELYAGEKKTE